MKIVITDVSVFFDVFSIGVLPEFFGMDWEIHTTDFVYNEILRADQKEAFEAFERSNRLNIIGFNNEEEHEVKVFKTKFSNRSMADKTILFKAIKMKATLLTCDNKLKKEAESHSLEVHGSIWVLKQLVESGHIESNEGIKLLEKLILINNRLPLNEIEKLKKEWTK